MPLADETIETSQINGYFVIICTLFQKLLQFFKMSDFYQCVTWQAETTFISWGNELKAPSKSFLTNSCQFPLKSAERQNEKV